MKQERKQEQEQVRDPASLVTSSDATPLAEFSLLEQVAPQVAASLRRLREHWVKQFELRTAAEMLILDQALLAYAHALRINALLARAEQARRKKAEDGQSPPVEARRPGGRKSERNLRMLVRLNRMFLRNLNAMRKWRTQEVGPAMMDSLIASIRKDW